MVRELKIRNYSIKTVKSYLYSLREYFFFKKHHFKLLDQDNIKDFLLHCEQKGISAQSRNLFLNAIKFYYHNVTGPQSTIQIRSAKKPKSLPVVLSRDEIGTILTSPTNQKHQLPLALAYGSGMRVSEVVASWPQEQHKRFLNMHSKNQVSRKTQPFTVYGTVLQHTC